MCHVSPSGADPDVDGRGNDKKELSRPLWRQVSRWGCDEAEKGRFRILASSG